jgi:ribose transport system substrate-binding protein
LKFIRTGSSAFEQRACHGEVHRVSSGPNFALPSEAEWSLNNRSVLRACTILQCFAGTSEALGLSDIVSKTSLNKATAYRLLSSLVTGGMLERRGKNSYVAASHRITRTKYRIGYAAQSEEFAFSRLVSDSIRSSAYEVGCELLVLDNRYSATVAMRNADQFMREHVDLVIEFQTNYETAHTIGSRLVDASIPVIAIEVPHPGGIFYGANNYRAGQIAGHALAQACAAQWQGDFDELLLLELPMAGPLVRSRSTGLVDELRKRLPSMSGKNIRFLNGAGRFETSWDVTRKHLRNTRSHRVLIGAMNDPSCLGALRAFEEAGRAEDCLAISHNGILEGREELRSPNSRLVGSVAYFPEQYGEAVMELALNKLLGSKVPSATFVRHQLLHRGNVDAYYPNDLVASTSDDDLLLYSRR